MKAKKEGKGAYEGQKNQKVSKAYESLNPVLIIKLTMKLSNIFLIMLSKLILVKTSFLILSLNFN
jgi:hypothetical protein